MAPAPAAPSRTGHVPRPAAWAPLRIDPARCKGCELCVAACAKGALALDVRTVNVLGYHPVRLVAPELCTSDAFCARVCPDAVFTVFARPGPTRATPSLPGRRDPRSSRGEA